LTCPKIVPNRTLVAVHGMASSVEGSFTDMFSNSNFLGNSYVKYDAVYGFDYDWWNGITQNGTTLSTFLAKIASCAGGNPIDVIAHSEGVPVSLAALTAGSFPSVRHLIALGGPMLGTPIASVVENEEGVSGRFVLATVLANMSSQMVQPPGALDLLNAQFAQDLEPNSIALNQIKTQLSNAPPAQLQIIAIAGTDPGILGFLGSTCCDVFQNQPFDGIVGEDSAWGTGLSLANVPYRNAFFLFHTDLTNTAKNPDVLAAIEPQLYIPAAPVTGPTAHFTMSSQGSTAYDGGTLNLIAPSSGNVSVALSSTSTQGTAAITSYSWTSGGNVICASASCSLSLANVTQNVDVTLNIADANSKQSSAIGHIAVSAQQSAQAPTVVTGSASSITTNSATLLGTVNPNGADTSFSFQYGTSSTLAGYSQTPPQDVGAGRSASNISANIAQLSPGTTYYFRLVANNSIGLTIGTSIGSFTTASVAQSGPTAHFTMTGQGQTISDPGTLSLSVATGATAPVNLASTSTQGSAPITSYVWKVNGTQYCSSTPSCVVNMGGAGNATVTLTVTDSNGKPSTATGSIYVTATNPTPTISSISPNSFTVGQEGGGSSATITGTGFTSQSYHQFSTSLGVPWTWASVAPWPGITPTSMTIDVATSTAQTIYFRVCTYYGSTVCSNSVSVTVH
jgi:hypothetical protein